jgi:uncharacterized protein with von Willebrand factor type A (vWA) domain
MFVGFLYELRKRGVPVGAQEAVALARALEAGLHDSALDGFYHVARSLLVHSESQLDPFDQAFAFHFKGIESAGVELAGQLLDWLKQARKRPDLTPEEAKLLEQFDVETLEELFQRRLREQRKRHDGGNRWIGTGGTSPFGNNGADRDGFRIGGEGQHHGALKLADARLYQSYRDDAVLDVRQMSVALRKLRAFAREGAPVELDLDETIAKTAKNAGELEIVTRPPRRPNTRVILMMDVGGSMDPYADLVSRLFSAASKATHFKELRTYYFHNCVYGRVYHAHRLDEPVTIPDLLAECGPHYKLILVGDALMAPYELFSKNGEYGFWDTDGVEGIVWLMQLAGHFERCAWLNPEPWGSWHGNTIEAVRKVFPMFPLTVEGLGQAVDLLLRGGKGARVRAR